MTGVAGGNISPSRFLIRSTTEDNKYLQASSTSVAIAGISQPGTRNTPYSSLDDGYAAIAGENLHVFQAGKDNEAPLEYGRTVAAGALLSTDSSGRCHGHGRPASRGAGDTGRCAGQHLHRPADLGTR